MKLTTVKTPFHHVTHKKEGWFDDIKMDLIAAAVSQASLTGHSTHVKICADETTGRVYRYCTCPRI